MKKILAYRTYTKTTNPFDANNLVFTTATTEAFLDAMDLLSTATAEQSPDHGEIVYSCDGFTVAISHRNLNGTITYYLPIFADN